MGEKYNFFSDPEYAGPNHGSLIVFWDRSPRTLRVTPRKTMPEYRFPNSNAASVVEMATADQSTQISRFFNDHYRGSDWQFNITFGDVERWLSSGFIIIIRYNSEIVGTIVCRDLHGVICGSPNSHAVLVHGLVVHPKFRKNGLGSFLMASMDYVVFNTPRLSRAILIWFREHDTQLSAYSQVPISVLKYSYIKISDIQLNPAIKVSKITTEHALKLVKTISENTQSQFTLISNSSDEDVYWFLVDKSVIAIANTHRLGHGGLAIWELVFAANMTRPYFTDLQTAIEQSAYQLPCSKGMIFATNGLSRGNLVSPAGAWVSGKSGYLTTNVYNWMPPNLLSGDIIFPSSCI